MTQDEVSQERYENSPERYNEPSHIHGWTDEMRKEAKLRAVERKRERGFNLISKEKVWREQALKSEHGVISQIVNMQKLLDDYEGCIHALYFYLFWGEKIRAKLPDNTFSNQIQKLWEYIDFLNTKHPEFREEWMKEQANK